MRDFLIQTAVVLGVAIGWMAHPVIGIVLASILVAEIVN